MGLYLGSTKIPTISLYKQGGIIPSGVFTIPSNISQSTYDITSYAFAQGDFGYGRLPERISGDLSYYENLSATQIASYAFYNTPISSINMPNVISIYESAFYSCSNLTSSISFSLCTTIGSYAFYRCININSVNLPKCQIINQRGFYSCDNLSQVSILSCLSVGAYAFAYCSKLESINLPLASNLSAYAFRACTSLSYASLYCTTMGSNVFASCYNLLSLYLLSNTVCSLSNTNAFASTPISNYTTSTGGVYGSIFVPSSLLTAYKAATN